MRLPVDLLPIDLLRIEVIISIGQLVTGNRIPLRLKEFNTAITLIFMSLDNELELLSCFYLNVLGAVAAEKLVEVQLMVHFPFVWGRKLTEHFNF